MRLIDSLPRGARLWDELGDYRAWTAGEHLAAYHIDYDALVAWSQGGRKGPKPKPVKRPADIAEDRAQQQRKKDAEARNERIAKAMHRALKSRGG